MRKYFLPKNAKCHDSKSFRNITMTAAPFLTCPYTSLLLKLPCKREKNQAPWASMLSKMKEEKKVTDYVNEISEILI